MKPVTLIECFRKDILNIEEVRRRLRSTVPRAKLLNFSTPSHPISATTTTQDGNQNNDGLPYPNNLNHPLQLTMAIPTSHIENKPNMRKFKHFFKNIPLLGTFINWTYKVTALPIRFYRLQQDFANRAAWIDNYGNYLVQVAQDHNHKILIFEKKIANFLIELQALRDHSLTQADEIARLESELEHRAQESHLHKNQLQRQNSEYEQLKKKLNTITLIINQHIELVSASRQEPTYNNRTLKELSDTLDEIRAMSSQLEASVSTIQINQHSAAHTIHHASNLAYDTAHKVHIESEEIRIRLLRLERKLKHFTNPAATLESASALAATTNQRNFSSKANLAATYAEGDFISDSDFDYFMFTHKFRGSTEEIKNRQSMYLEYFEGRENVVDLGCGRGEFLSLLAENGIPACGIDLSDDNIDYCLEFGLNVQRDDIFNYLTLLPDDSIDGIFSAQVIEHLTPSQIIRLVNLCSSKLKKNGVLILESVNTNCVQALKDFYLDPTHVRPVHPDFMQYLLQSKMFKMKPIKFSTPLSPDLAPVQDSDSGALITNYVDYAVIGHKA